MKSLEVCNAFGSGRKGDRVLPEGVKTRSRKSGWRDRLLLRFVSAVSVVSDAPRAWWCVVKGTKGDSMKGITEMTGGRRLLLTQSEASAQAWLQAGSLGPLRQLTNERGAARTHHQHNISP